MSSSMKVLVYMLGLTGIKVLMCDKFEDSSIQVLFARFLTDLDKFDTMFGN